MHTYNVASKLKHKMLDTITTPRATPIAITIAIAIAITTASN